MNNEQPSIHDFDFNLICDYYSSLQRQGPGSPDVTVKALGFIEGLDDDSRIADIGCGTGTQTMTLARNTPGHITGVDLFPVFIDTFNRNAARSGLSPRVRGIIGDMAELPFADGEFDLIWSEGAIYNIGYERGLREWRRFIKESGYICVSEVSWLTPERPAEIEEFWMDAYSEIDTVPAKVLKMEQAGYVPVAHFILPVECWTKHFYEPMPAAEEIFLAKHPDNPTAAAFIDNQRHERQLYMKYKDYYGYVFYIGKKA